ncbi:Cell division protein FtsI/penicillin-binding protein 2 [Hyella patelloides LEGE 07179]|uniref:Cell division protein FtsI/penicillin-binding protein 2 n=1 Tax=Hyella patelloides LEGE 07179 TaxID=945734 RepID=A0A563VIJ7_9CYAN|nr:penicillin-binding protein 2 [Hyella patelloides]VEP11266.1 Cell division protein FtsI/penicillin-binding protein 2 [Hyella patelloides LEGE 07179]
MATKKRSRQQKTIISPHSAMNARQPSTKRVAENLSPQVVGRLIFVWGVLLLAAIAITGRLYVLQVAETIPIAEDSEMAKEDTHLRQLAGKTYKEIAKNQQNTILEPYTPRRQIVDSQQNILATDVITYKLYIHPNLFIRNRQQISAQEIAQQLADILDTKTADEFLTYFQDKNKKGIPLPENISDSAVAKIRALSIDGLDVRKQYSRVYPHKEMVAEVIGYINDDSDRQPQAGVEYTQNELLIRKPIRLKLKRSFSKQDGKKQKVFFPGYLERSRPFLAFDDRRLQLTIDLRLQQSARAALKATMDEFQAKRGTVIVMDVSDGSILAMVCDPTYDPNQYQQYTDYSLFKNWAVTDLYEPGSTFKPINIAIALDEGVITPKETIEDTGKIKIGTDTVRNHDYYDKGARGEMTIPEILQQSSNVGMIKIMERIAPEKYYQRLKELGIEDKLELEIPGSTAGTLKDEIEFTVREIEPATASFGQGFSLTPLKLLQIHAAIANNGKIVTPHVVRGLSDFDGYLHYSLPKQETEIFSEKTTRTVLEMMETVVQDGSGKAAKIANYRIAGKTGTSQKSDLTTGYYAENAKITSFVGIFPVEKPRYAVLAVVDEPQGRYTFGSNVAAPVVGEVIKAIIAHKGIEPVESESKR